MMLGVRADQYRDFAALRGDPSDNLPGVRGIGPKTAARLLCALGFGPGRVRRCRRRRRARPGCDRSRRDQAPGPSRRAGGLGAELPGHVHARRRSAGRRPRRRPWLSAVRPARRSRVVRGAPTEHDGQPGAAGAGRPRLGGLRSGAAHAVAATAARGDPAALAGGRVCVGRCRTVRPGPGAAVLPAVARPVVVAAISSSASSTDSSVCGAVHRCRPSVPVLLRRARRCRSRGAFPVRAGHDLAVDVDHVAAAVVRRLPAQVAKRCSSASPAASHQSSYSSSPNGASRSGRCAASRPKPETNSPLRSQRRGQLRDDRRLRPRRDQRHDVAGRHHQVKGSGHVERPGPGRRRALSGSRPARALRPAWPGRPGPTAA